MTVSPRERNVHAARRTLDLGPSRHIEAVRHEYAGRDAAGRNRGRVKRKRGRVKRKRGRVKRKRERVKGGNVEEGEDTQGGGRSHVSVMNITTDCGE